ncbi:thermopsin family protease [Vulcanisaeta thermophila]|uniref:thermopsin family protease n=1 Tax=Vulcanisaeta thermophila TaxID=867917 RepID=UPI001389830F|nr:thermopsin family protease [Vulcanisaeta thermophila]
MRGIDLIVLSLVLVFILGYLVLNPGILQYVIQGINGIIKSINYTGIPSNLSSVVITGPCMTYLVIPINAKSGEALFLDSVSNSLRSYLLTSDEYSAWSPPSAPLNYVYSLNGSGVVIWQLSTGNYDLVLCGQSIANSVSYRVLRYDGMGVSAVHGYNNTAIATNTVVGFFNITNASILNSSGIPNGFSLQLNVYIAVNSDGQVTYHWFQNALVVSGNYYWFQGEVDVTHYIGSSQSINYVNGVCTSGCFETPMAGYLIITVRNTGNGAVVMFGYSITRLGNITFNNPGINWFAQYPIPNAQAEIVVSPEIGPYGWPLDAEFVIAGPGNGGGVEFESLNATLALYYWNGTSLVPFPRTYSFAISTAEYAVNVHVTPMGPGTAELTVGPNNYEEWG